MTAVAVGTVPDITLDATVLGIGLSLRMAIRADEHGVIRRIGVAVATELRSTVWYWEPCVIERRARPGCCRMARLAGGWKPSGNVIRIGYAIVIGLVTRVAIGRNARVIAVHVAVCTSDRRVRAS